LKAKRESTWTRNGLIWKGDQWADWTIELSAMRAALNGLGTGKLSLKAASAPSAERA